ncbi:MAG: TylF/MycF/NovP-related O-methyltransferase [Bryobacterales bacterium]|nr:TylF/MycF/NovP-related O-methyltransferase [Bryobacterales bacterium]
MRLLYLRFFVPAVLTGDAERIRKVLAVFRVMPHSLVGRRGLEATHDVVRNVILRQIEGAVVECGVARGGSAALMGLLTEDTPGRPLWLFDSYEGLPEPTAEDFRDGVTGRHVRPLPKGSCLGTYETVQRLLFSTFRLSRNRVFMVKGWFQDTLCSQSNNIGDIAVLRIDADWYDSVRCCLEALYDRVLPGGFVVIDDYGSCFGAQRAVDEFLASRQVAVSLVPDGRGGAHFQKPFIH